jgi:hypothetical protein
VASALRVEAVVAPVECVVVDAAQALAAAIAELRRPLSAMVARRHSLVERPEPTSLDLFARLCLQILMGTVLRIRTSRSGWMMRRSWMSARSRMRIRMVRFCMMLGVRMGARLGLRLGFHVDSLRKNFSAGHSLFLTCTLRAE